MIKKYLSNIGNKYCIITIIIIVLVSIIGSYVYTSIKLTRMENKYNILDMEYFSTKDDYLMLRNKYDKLDKETRLYTSLSEEERAEIDKIINEKFK